MSQGNGDGLHPVRHAHVVRCTSRSLADDGSQGVLQLEAANGGLFFLRIDAGGLLSVCGAAQALQNDSVHRGGGYVFGRPMTFGVVDSPEYRGHTILALNPQTPQESAFLLPDDMALEMSRQLRDRALAHMTPERRAREIGKLKMIDSAFGRIILPRER